VGTADVNASLPVASDEKKRKAAWPNAGLNRILEPAKRVSPGIVHVRHSLRGVCRASASIYLWSPSLELDQAGWKRASFPPHDIRVKIWFVEYMVLLVTIVAI
jgi:hypothetical protein